MFIHISSTKGRHERRDAAAAKAPGVLPASGRGDRAAAARLLETGETAVAQPTEGVMGRCFLIGEMKVGSFGCYGMLWVLIGIYWDITWILLGCVW